MAQKKDKSWLEADGQKYQEEEDKYVEERVSGNEELETEEQKDSEQKRLRYDYFTKTICGQKTWEDWKAPQTLLTPVASSKGSKPTSREMDREKDRVKELEEETKKWQEEEK